MATSRAYRTNETAKELFCLMDLFNRHLHTNGIKKPEEFYNVNGPVDENALIILTPKLNTPNAETSGISLAALRIVTEARQELEAAIVETAANWFQEAKPDEEVECEFNTIAKWEERETLPEKEKVIAFLDAVEPVLVRLLKRKEGNIIPIEFIGYSPDIGQSSKSGKDRIAYQGRNISAGQVRVMIGLYKSLRQKMGGDNKKYISDIVRDYRFTPDV